MKVTIHILRSKQKLQILEGFKLFMKISIIAVMDQKRGIGKDNRIPWHIKEDLVRLKNLTRGRVVILGRKSYDSMVFYYNRTGNPMPGELYLIVTRDKNYKPARENASAVNSLEEAFEIAGKDNGREIFIIGGGQIFNQVLPLADKLYLTVVAGNYSCDTFFPDYSNFKKIVSSEKRESSGYRYTFLELEK